MRKMVWLVLVVLLLIGVGVSVADYRKWKFEETRNFGHGPEDGKQVVHLGDLYQNQIAGIRIRYPEGWEEYTYPDYRKRPVVEGEVEQAPKITTRQVASFFPDGQKQDGYQLPRIEIEAEINRGNLPDLANAELKRLQTGGWQEIRDRAYVVTDNAQTTVLTVAYEGEINILGLVKRGDKYFKIKYSGGEMDYEVYEKTFESMLRSLILL